VKQKKRVRTKNGETKKRYVQKNGETKITGEQKRKIHEGSIPHAILTSMAQWNS
jgi:hypothetical protein